MILLTLILIPLVGGIVAWYGERFNDQLPRWIALVAMLACMVLLLPFLDAFTLDQLPRWLVDEPLRWIPRLNITAHLAMDGLSLLLVLLTVLMGLVALSSAWTEIKQRSGFFYLNLLWTLAGVMGVFLAMDLFLFFVFWEVMLVPMYFLIAIWGYENRHYAAFKFFLFT